MAEQQARPVIPGHRGTTMSRSPATGAAPTDAQPQAELERSNAALRERIWRLESIIEGTHVGTWEWNVQSGETVFNERWADILGYTLAELAPVDINTWLSLAHPEDLKESARLLDLHFAGEVAYYDCECRMRHKAGHWVWVHDRGRVFTRTADGKPLLMFGTHTEISERKRAEEVARAARRHREELIASIDGIVWEADAATFTFTFVSAQAERLLGYPIRRWLEEPSFWTDHIHPDDRKSAVEYCVACTREALDHRFDYRMRAADGRYVWLKDVVTVLVENGRPVKLRGVMVDITQRKQAEEAWRESEERLKLAVKASNVGLWDWDLSTNRVAYSREWKAQLGYEEHEIGDAFSEWESRVHPDDLEPTLAIVRAYLVEPEGAYEVEFRMRHRDGSWRWIFARGETLAGPSGAPQRFVGGHVDITERKRIEASLRVSEERYALVAAGANDAIWDWDVVNHRVYLSPRWKEMRGFGLDEVGDHEDEWMAGIHPEDSPRVLDAVRAHLADKTKLFATEYRVRCKEGSWRWILDRGIAQRDASGTVVRMAGSASDITERKQVELALRESEGFLSAVYNNSEIGIFVVDVSPSGAYTYAGINPTQEKLTGIKNDLLLGKGPDDLLDLLGAETVAYIHALYERCIQERRSLESEFYAPHGAVQGWWLLKLTPLFEQETGRVVRLIGSALSITAHKQAELLMRESEERLQLAIQTSNVGLWDWELGTHRVSYSREWKSQLGYQDQEVSNDFSEWQRRVHPDDLARTQAALRIAAADGAQSVEYRLRHKDNSWRWIYARTQVLRDASGTPLRLLVGQVDVTERHQLEEQLRQSQRMDAIGQLAGGVAHDFNNLLTVIQGNAEQLREAQDYPASEQAEAVAEICQAAERAAGLTRQLLTFSRRQVLHARSVDLNSIVRNLFGMLKRILGEQVRLQLELLPSPLTIHADSGLLEQVLVNLAVNARDAMPEGGVLSFETSEVPIHSEDLSRYPEAEPGPYVRLRVTDSGSGIAPEHLERIFEPFFTTKEVGKGTGLGLSTVFGVVKQHNGFLRVTSQLGQGTTFDVFVPALQGVATTLAPTALDTATVRGGGEVILVVEDEASVLLLVQRLLEQAGYRVFTAPSGVEALTLCEEGNLGVDLVLTDVIMPGGVSGQQLVQQLRERTPDLRVVYMSGYMGELAARNSPPFLQDGVSFLQKPFTPAALLHCVRNHLRSH